MRILFQDDLLTNYYPQRPSDLEHLCLHDFVRTYNYYGRDQNGDRNYRKLQKEKLIDHDLFDPENVDQRESYFYSLLLLFLPFRDENKILLPDEKAEEAYKRLLANSQHCSRYHITLQKMIKDQRSQAGY